MNGCPPSASLADGSSDFTPASSTSYYLACYLRALLVLAVATVLAALGTLEVFDATLVVTVGDAASGTAAEGVVQASAVAFSLEGLETPLWVGTLEYVVAVATWWPTAAVVTGGALATALAARW
ncbi:hypothetical protein [Natronobiforma cellulositropha]|uniref:hypothetical protein n=1 Tax=Natronobiforma cellulositropha TaxID=1679076 RepID=UPI0021D5D93B|nr:hypothetical protein [Natronobiforma cellulositropha]